MNTPSQDSVARARLTPAQEKVLARLEGIWAAGGRVDSLESLCALLGLRSRGALHRHVEALVREGFVLPLDRHRHGLRPGPAARPTARTAPARAAGRSRPRDPGAAAAQVAWQQGRVRALPRLGRIAAGAPLDAVFDEDPVWVPELLIPPGEAYVLEVRGDSMSGDGIFDGDLVVVEVGANVRPGEIAVILVAGEGATLKRFRQEGALMRLQASNPAVADRIVAAEAVAIQGRVRGLMRSYRG